MKKKKINLRTSSSLARYSLIQQTAQYYIVEAVQLKIFSLVGQVKSAEPQIPDAEVFMQHLSMFQTAQLMRLEGASK
jgi:hypothetical protein